MAVTDPINKLPEVHVFSAKGNFLHKFKVVQGTNRADRVVAKAIHWTNEDLIVVSIPHYFSSPPFLSSYWDTDVKVYKEDEKLVNHFSIMKFQRIDDIKGVTLNSQGRIWLRPIENCIEKSFPHISSH